MYPKWNYPVLISVSSIKFFFFLYLKYKKNFLKAYSFNAITLFILLFVLIFTWYLIFRASRKRRWIPKGLWPTVSSPSMNFLQRQLHWLSLISQMHQWLCRLLRAISLETINVTVLWQLTRWDNICASWKKLIKRFWIINIYVVVKMYKLISNILMLK